MENKKGTSSILFGMLLILILVITATQVFPVAYSNPAKYQLVYDNTPRAGFDFTDLNLYQNTYSDYTGRDFPLPRYIPQYLSQDLYLKGYSALSKKVTGMYVPRYFDGEKYTNFRIDGYNPRELNVTEKAYLDEASLIVVPASNTQKKCNYVAYWQFSRDFTPDYGKGNRTLYDVYYYYDLGYWYVDEIRKSFLSDCAFTYSDKKSPSKPSIYYYEDNTYGYVWDRYVMDICNKNSGSFFNLPVDNAFWGNVAKRYNASSMTDLAIKLYEDTTLITPLSEKLSGNCLVYNSFTNSNLSFPCFPRSVMIEDIRRKDDWLLKVINGNYMPKYLSISGKNIETHLSLIDTQFKECKEFFLKTSAYQVMFNKNKQQMAEICQNYLQEQREELLKLQTDFTSKGVANMIWSHYKNDYNIPKGTNLYPFNINYAGIRCRENDTWRTYSVTPVSPNAQSPYVECNYTSSDPQVVNVGFNFQVKINPAFAMVAGSDSILESYNADYLRTIFQTYTFLNGNTTPNINIKNYSDGASITAYFSVNRSKEDGCSFVFLTNTSASIITEKLKELTYQAQKNAENVPPEVSRQLEVQVRLLKSEEKKTQFYYYVDVVAKLVFRAFILFYYIVSMILFLYVIKLIITLPTQIINVLNNLGMSKKHRQQNSILHK